MLQKKDVSRPAKHPRRAHRADAPQEVPTDQLLEALAKVYHKKEKSAAFDTERPIYVKLIPKLIKALGSAYILEKPFAMGSTATVWRVHDRHLNQTRALKLARPDLSKIENIIVVFRGERDRLANLNHQNIIKIYGSDEVKLNIRSQPYSFPYFVMEFLHGVEDLDKYIVSNLTSLSGDRIISYFQDLISGIAFLHEQKIIHCDIKPGNLLIAPNKPALVADLGYSKHLQKPAASKETEVSYTRDYAHPELRQKIVDSKDSAANVARIPQKDLKPKFDLFAFGRSLQDVMNQISEFERTAAENGDDKPSVFTTYQWTYLSYISKRLLDGKIERREKDEFKSDNIGGLPEAVMEEIRYLSADDALEDFEKLLKLYDLEGEIPELNVNSGSFIQIPHCQVPLTPRVEKVINHPRFKRLAQVSQLGFVSLIYPSANHTRYEHVLGTFTHCCAYIRALWYDQANPLFQCLMKKEHLELGLIAALIHDIGQYPMSHDLTEICSDFEHEKFTQHALETREDSSGECLADIIDRNWGVKLNDLMQVLNAKKGSPFRDRILHALISGPLDCDKLDYLKRDSTHLGVRFGFALDDERLLRNLTLAYQVGDDGSLEIAETGVTEKARVVAQAVWRTRKDMFTQVYWHHTARAVKAMLTFVVRNILIDLAKDSETADDLQSRFWRSFDTLIMDPMNFVPANNCVEEGARDVLSDEQTESDFVDDPKPSHGNLTSSHLTPTDNFLLLFLWDFGTDDVRRMIRAIQERVIYKRVAVLSASEQEAEFNSVYSFFRERRISNELDKLEADRLAKETKIINKIKEVLPNKKYLVQPESDVDATVEELRCVKPLILIDVPLKSFAKVEEKKASLLYLPERASHVNRNQPDLFPRFKPSELETVPFDRDVGKIRVLCHPRWFNLVTDCLTQDEIVRLISH